MRAALNNDERALLAETLGSITLTADIWELPPHMGKVTEAVAAILDKRMEPLRSRAIKIEAYALDMSRAGAVDVSVPLQAVAKLMREIADGDIAT